MRILVCYASTEGQTRKICRFCCDQLIAQGHSVEMIPAGDAEDVETTGFDAALLAGSVHIGKIQPELAAFAQAHGATLNAMPSLYLQVSLAAAGQEPDEMAELDQIATDFCAGADWTPTAVHQIAGAFRFTQYDFFKSWAMRYIAGRYGQQVKPGEDKEYTDWQALADLMRGWPADLGS